MTSLVGSGDHSGRSLKDKAAPKEGRRQDEESMVTS